jgi:hypothetical protein
MDASRLDDDAVEAVAASCLATQELARALAARPVEERVVFWNRIGRGLVPRWRLTGLAFLEDPGDESIARFLSPSDLYRLGRRLEQAPPPEAPPLPVAARAQAAIARLEGRCGPTGARERLAEFGPRAAAYAGRYGLADIEMPSYERLATYRLPDLLADRLYDLKIAVACRLAQAGLPAAVLPVVLPSALDGMLVSLKMAYPYDWKASARAAASFSSAELERALNEAVVAGRLEFEEAAQPAGGP